MALTRKIPWRITLAYIFDWVVIAIILAIGGGLSYTTPNTRLFSPTDPRISFPYSNEHVSTSLLFVLCVVIPGVTIALVTFLLVPAPISLSRLRTLHTWTAKAWELHAGWLGLALANVLALLINQVFKVSFGRPRPDFLDRCRPDLSSLGAAGGITALLPTQLLLDRSACTVTDKHRIDDGFKAFFSGHAANSFAGLVYLSLWLALKTNTILPRPDRPRPFFGRGEAAGEDRTTAGTGTGEDGFRLERKPGASAPPTWGAGLFFAPILLASWITATRWIDYRHDGWDLTVGVLVGTLCAAIAFRWYHADPLLSGESWTYSPRGEGEAWLLRPGRIGRDGERIPHRGKEEIGLEAGANGAAPARVGLNNGVHGEGYATGSRPHTATSVNGHNGAQATHGLHSTQATATQPIQPYEQA